MKQKEIINHQNYFKLKCNIPVERKLLLNNRKFSDQVEIAIIKQTQQIKRDSSPNLKIKESLGYNYFILIQWPKRWFYIIKFLSKLMSGQPKKLKQTNLM
ncbi:unnamed protein product [Paramecium sonneborni]|uniref:Uncharacterized protein n=1 Tax=Paramecium sonneborni TaxID=65129 RepID=A0A8S1Q9Q5_9CILI|nr:unnamed protein product [Paramecium sonneborni]